MRIDPSMIYNQYHKQHKVSTENAKVNVAKSLLEGQVIKGTIIDSNQSGVKLQMANGEIIEAKIASELQYAISDHVTLLVESMDTDQITMSTMTDAETLATDKLMNILEQAGLPTTNDKLKMLSLLMENKMPVNQESLKAMVRLMKQFPEAPVKHLVFMAKHQIPINSENLNQMAMLENNEHALTRGLASLVDDVTQTIQTQTSNNQESSALNQGSQLVELVNSDPVITTQQKGLTDLLQVLQPKVLEGGRQLSDLVSTTQGNVALSDVMMAGDLEILGAKLNQVFTQMDSSQLSDQQVTNLEQLPSLESLNFSQLVELADQELLTLDQLRTFIMDAKDSHTYMSLSKGLMVSDIATVEQGEVAQYFNALQEKLSLIANNDVVKQSLEGGKVLKSTGDVKASVNFMNAMNQDFNFMHLPMFVGEQLLHSELYVMNDSKVTKDGEKPITALIRLDLLNLGHTDIYVKKVGKNVDVQFFMTDEDQITTVREHMVELDKVLTNKGFNVLSSSVQTASKAFDVVDDFLEVDSKEGSQKRFTFDMRA